ncbi:MAG: hypothetical protein KF890_08675 [Nitrospira sp.]|nr:hypothetical protein [Nitrospira sp.]
MNCDWRWAIGWVSACSWCFVSPVTAIEVHPSQTKIQTALDRGRSAGAQHQPPERWYARFGGTGELEAGGFLLTKLGSLSVMATHMARRGLDPSATDIAQVVGTPTMLVNAVIFGDDPSFATDSYMLFDQKGKTIKPVMVRVDGQAERSTAWPETPRFKAKIVASFAYTDFDPSATTTITLYPAHGGEISFSLDFAQIE